MFLRDWASRNLKRSLLLDKRGLGRKLGISGAIIWRKRSLKGKGLGEEVPKIFWKVWFLQMSLKRKGERLFCSRSKGKTQVILGGSNWSLRNNMNTLEWSKFKRKKRKARKRRSSAGTGQNASYQMRSVPIFTQQRTVLISRNVSLVISAFLSTQM